MAKQKKILHIITKLELGGAQLNTVYTVNNIKNHKMYLAFGPGGILPNIYPIAAEKEYLIKNLKRKINIFSDLKALCEIFKILKKEKFDIVHTHSSKAGILGRLACKLAGIKEVYHTVHGFGFNDRQPVFKRRFFIFLERLCFKFTSKLIFVSRRDIKTALKEKIIYSDADALLIRSGIDINYFKKISCEPDKLSLNLIHPYTVTAVACLKPQKNLTHFILAAAEIVKKQKCNFLIIGDGAEKDKLKDKIRELNLIEYFIFTGWQKEIRRYLKITDIFCLTSLWEGLPRAVLEALALNVPCVCYNTGGIGEAVKDGKNGFLVPQGDYKKLADCILKALNYKFDFKESVLYPEFDINYMIKQLEELYSKIN